MIWSISLKENIKDKEIISYLRGISEKQFLDKVFSFLRHTLECIFVKIPVASFHILKSFQVILASKWWQTTQSDRKTKLLEKQRNFKAYKNFELDTFVISKELNYKDSSKLFAKKKKLARSVRKLQIKCT